MIKVIGIAGDGQMGTAIAEVNLRAGHTILLYDNNNKQLTNQKIKLKKIYMAAIQKVFLNSINLINISITRQI